MLRGRGLTWARQCYEGVLLLAAIVHSCKRSRCTASASSGRWARSSANELASRGLPLPYARQRSSVYRSLSFSVAL